MDAMNCAGRGVALYRRISLTRHKVKSGGLVRYRFESAKARSQPRLLHWAYVAQSARGLKS